MIWRACPDWSALSPGRFPPLGGPFDGTQHWISSSPGHGYGCKHVRSQYARYFFGIPTACVPGTKVPLHPLCDLLRHIPLPWGTLHAISTQHCEKWIWERRNESSARRWRTWTLAGSLGHRSSGYEIPLPKFFKSTNGFTGLTDGSLQLDVLWHVPLPSFALQESPMARANHLLSKFAPKVVATESASIVMRDILNMVKGG